MRRETCVPLLALLVILNLVHIAHGQATPATQAPAPPVAPAKWAAPLKGPGTIDVIRGKPHRVGNDMVSVLKVKNTSKAPIALLTVEEYWYNAKRQTVSGDTQRHKQLIPPGEVIEMTTRSPWKSDMSVNLFVFRHANGKIDAKAVSKF